MGALRGRGRSRPGRAAGGSPPLPLAAARPALASHSESAGTAVSRTVSGSGELQVRQLATGPQSESSGPLSLGRPGPRSRRRNPSSRTQWPGRGGRGASGFQTEAQAPCMCAGGRPAPGRQGGEPESWQRAVTVLAAGSDLTTSGPPRRARMTCPTGHRQGHGCRRRRRRRPWQLPSPRRTWQFKLTMIT